MFGIFLDLETTGLDPQKHCVVEIAFCFIHLITGEKTASYESIIKTDAQNWEKSDPISLEVNGFSWEKASRGKPLEKAAREIQSLFIHNKIQRGSSVFVCQNPSFDRAFFAQIIDVYTQENLLWPYHWLDLASMYFAKIFHPQKISKKQVNKLSLSKNQIASYYGLAPEKEPHGAMRGVEHLVDCYQSLMGFPDKL